MYHLTNIEPNTNHQIRILFFFCDGDFVSILQGKGTFLTHEARNPKFLKAIMIAILLLITVRGCEVDLIILSDSSNSATFGKQKKILASLPDMFDIEAGAVRVSRI